MSDFAPRCPKCDKVMDRGHVPDAAHGTVLRASWAPGLPIPRRFIGGIRYRADELVPLTAWRCPKCGYVELYARAE